MNLWDELVTSAVVGTDRRTPPRPQASGALGQALAKINAPNPALRLLASAAIVAAHRRAGRIAPTRPMPLNLCDEEHLARCPDALSHFLEQMWSGIKAKVLREWLENAEKLALRAAEHHLPTLLQLGRAHPELRKALRPILGKRGIWIASQNPEWRWATAVDKNSDSVPYHSREIDAPRARAIWAEFWQVVKQNDSTVDPWSWKPVLADFASGVPVTMIGELVSNWSARGQAPERWSELLEEVRSLLLFRMEMDEAFRRCGKILEK